MIKICGIRDAELAEQAALAGADYIGIVFHPTSSRYVDLDQARLISHAVRKAGALPVGVFVNQTDVEMRHICEVTDINIAQLHGAIARAYHHLLPATYQKIYVLNLTVEGQLLTDDGLQYLDSEKDMILIDHIEPGQGNKIDHLSFHYDLPFRWMLAGGLSPSNVVDAIQNFRPQGVDVSSGVEILRGEKNIIKIQQFITAVLRTPLPLWERSAQSDG